MTGLFSLSLVFAATACSKKEDSSIEEIPPVETEAPPTEAPEMPPDTPTIKDLSDQEIFWLSDYDLNPAEGNDRSAALAIFEEQFHGHITWIPCGSENKLDALSERLLSGEPVDMFPYDMTIFPQGVCKDLFQPLDDYINLNDEIWNDMQNAVSMYAQNGKHYVIPYDTIDPLLLIYSRQMLQENSLDDPYDLYQSGQWDWNAFMNLMQDFKDGGSGRYGLCGSSAGQGIAQSVGKPFVSFDGTAFSNNLADPDLKAAETLLAAIRDRNLYSSGWYPSFPASHDILFYAMPEWALSVSNASDPDADFMAVPFPKSPDLDQSYLSAEYAAHMLVKNSDKGEAVGIYISCERLAASQEIYQQSAKKQALEESYLLGVPGFFTEEQYNAIQNYRSDLTTIFDPGFGMGTAMYTGSGFANENSSAMYQLMNGLLSDQFTSWEALSASCSPAVDSAVSECNTAIQ